jgi:penicillin amidase
MPSLWYEIHLAGGELNVVGASLPGMPLVIIGHNDWIAWGVTDLYADVQDHYLELLNPEDANQYAAGEQWETLEVFSESIPVADASAETLEIFRTRHGVVVSDAPRDGKILALRWDALWTGDNMLAFLRMNQASNWLEFSEAIRTLGSVPLAFVYADLEGNIGLFPSGNLPLRSGFDGSVPVDGSSGEFEWQGYIPHEEKPFLLNPEDGVIVSANHRILFNESAPSLGADQLASFRAERVTSLLGPSGQMRVADFARIQADRYDRSTEAVLRHLMSIEFESQTSKDAHASLRSWNGQMSSGPAPAIYQAFYLELLENTFNDELGDELYRELLEFVELGYPGTIHTIVDDPASGWWDDKTTPAIEDRSAIFKRSFDDAVAFLEETQGSGPANWDWGKLHAVIFEHPMGRQPPFHLLFNRGPIDFGGSTHTVANARVSLSEPFKVLTGTSYRMIADLGDWNASLATIPTGASGHPLSRHYFDQNQGWLDGSGHPMLFDRANIESALAGRLKLTP